MGFKKILDKIFDYITGENNYPLNPKKKKILFGI